MSCQDGEIAAPAGEVFDWDEVIALFGIREAGDLKKAQRKAILKRINTLADDFGRDYVIRKIALNS